MLSLINNSIFNYPSPMNLAQLMQPLGEEDRMIKYFKLPTKQKCLIHRKTTILGKPIPNSQKCGCCGFRYQKEVLDPMFYPQDIYYLGSGLVLYFSFIKITGVLAFLGFIVFSVTNIYFNYSSQYCSTSNAAGCSPTLFTQLSIANKLNNQVAISIQSYLSIATAVLMFLALQIARTLQKNIEIEAESHLNPSHYSVMLKMPSCEYQQSDIKEIIMFWWETELNKGIKVRSHEFNIENVIISYELEQFNKLVEEKKRIDKILIKEKLTYEEKYSNQERIRAINAEIRNLKFPKTTKVVVVFQYTWQMEYIISRHQNTFLRVLFPRCFNFVRFNGKKVKISRAAMPSELNWENHFRKYKHKIGYRILIGLACMILILAGQGGIFGLLYYWYSKKQELDTVSVEYVSYVVSALVVIVNLILQKVLSILSKYEFRPTTLEEYVSVGVKKIIAIFLNSGIILLFVYLIVDKASIYMANGFVDTITLSFIYSLVVPHVLKYIDYDVLLSGFRRLTMNSNPQHIPQAEANKVYERVDPLIFDKYGWMINLLWWAGLFSPLVPVAFLIAFVSIFIHYWLERYNYVTIYREPKPFGSHLNNQMYKVLSMSPFFLAAGNLGMNVIILFITQEPLTVPILLFDIIGVGVSLLSFFVPTEVLDKLVRCCVKKGFSSDEITPYQSNLPQFITTYQKQNPIYDYINHQIISQPLPQQPFSPSPFQYKRGLSLNTDTIQGLNLNDNISDSLSPMAVNYPTKVFTRSTSKKAQINVPSLQIGWVTYNPTQRKEAQDRITYVTNMIAEVQNSEE